MPFWNGYKSIAPLAAALAITLAAVGCQPLGRQTRDSDLATTIRGQEEAGSAVGQNATELSMVTHPPYVLEPPDTLLLNAVKIVPKSPYLIQPLDLLQVVVGNALIDQPIQGVYPVDPSGMIQLGAAYGAVKVADLSIAEATVAIEKHLSVALRAPQVSVSLQQLAGQQQIVGEHLIGRDGTVTLGIYGSIHVAGKTVPEARAAIEQHLSQFLEAPKISVEVYTYASKTYYVIFDGAGQGVQMFSVPATGKETVLDAISVAGGLTPSSSSRIWIARPAPHRSGCEQILPVDWDDVTKYGGTATNFQIFPNDRVYVADDRMIRFANVVGKATQPFERVLGFMLLGSQAIQVSQRFPEGR